MVTTHNLGYPRIGARRELKFALEDYWKGQWGQESLLAEAKALRLRHWQQQAGLDQVPVGDFSFYDQVLDMSFTLGNIPARVAEKPSSPLDDYFRVARGRSAVDDCSCVRAGEMVKWFDTNYHYIVPEFRADTRFNLNADRLLNQIEEAKVAGVTPKPVIVGPVTYLWLGKAQDNSNRLALLDELLVVYRELLATLAQTGVEWVQVDEPILVTDLDQDWQHALNRSYHVLKKTGPNILLATYFGSLKENLQLACQLPVQGIHINAIDNLDEVKKLVDWLPVHKVVSLGVVNGRNIWKTNLYQVLEWLEPLAQQLGDRLWIAPNCSLLHVPVDLCAEDQLDTELSSWLAFAVQKLAELQVLSGAINQGRGSVADALAENQTALDSRRQSTRVHNPEVAKAVQEINATYSERASGFAQRSSLQRKHFQLPPLPTTTIGSFPQTAAIRQARRQFRAGELSEADYRATMEKEIAHCIQQQEALGLDVLVHGEAERNDMVEYFGEQLAGFAFSRFGWVQSYGSRCVKPPIIYGDVSRPAPMTVSWTNYAQTLSDKPVKGMLTGPVTILNWSFVRDDQPRRVTCRQIALAIRQEVQDLEAAGTDIIQIDEAALREGLPLRRSQWQAYLDWAVESFRISANGVKDSTQIHTHMCYSEFNDIIESIAKMDADVITIESSRSNMKLLDAFRDFDYPNEIGPGVYDIHSPNVPAVGDIVQRLKKASEKIPLERLWVNPDCGLKTRHWDEVTPSLENMVAATLQLRTEW